MHDAKPKGYLCLFFHYLDKNELFSVFFVYEKCIDEFRAICIKQIRSASRPDVFHPAPSCDAVQDVTGVRKLPPQQMCVYVFIYVNK